MRGDSIHQYVRILKITFGLLYLVVNQSWGQFYVGTACVDNATSSSCVPITHFFDTDTTSNAWIWNFGEAGAIASNTAITRNPTHQFPKIGTYTVSLTRKVGGVLQTPVTKIIQVGTPPTQPMFNKKKKADTTLCEGKLTLDPYKSTSTPSGVTYLWFPKGQTTPTIDVDSSGCYSVEVFSPEGCSSIAQITVKYCLQKANKPSQKNVWYFGDKGVLEFTQTSSSKPPWDSLANSGTAFSRPTNTSTSVTVSTGNLLSSPQAMAMVYGPAGNLLFYTNGKTILTGDNKAVPAIPPLTNTLSGDSNTTESVLIVPKNACNECPHHQYYVFTQDSKTKMLTYSIIDMRYNNQKGEIIQKDIPVYYPVGERLSSVFNSDSTGFWIVSHDSSNDKFIAMKLDSTGFTEQEQSVGLPENTVQSNKGYLQFSSDGNKAAIVVAENGKNYVEVYKFDRNKGQLQANPIRIEITPNPPPTIYGVAFSPDGQKLYVTLKGDPTSKDTTAQKSYLYQLNLNLGDATKIAATKILLDVSKKVSFGALELEPNSEKIYMAVDGATMMYNIQFPNTLGGANLVGYDKPPIGGDSISGISRFGLPNVVKAKPKDSDDGPSATYMNTCLNSTTIFEAAPLCSPLTNKYLWDFGDGETQETDATKVSHKYKKAGKYRFKLTFKTYEKVINSPIGGQIGQVLSSITKFCKDTTLIDSVYIRPSPLTQLPDTLYVCVLEGQSKTLDATAKGGTKITYAWKPTGDSTAAIQVSAIGIYHVHIQNNEGCMIDTLSVVRNGCEPIVLVPTAFVPDGLNNNFQVVAKYVSDFELHIFNRWGEQVYYTNNPLPDSRWDGSYNGYIFAPMNYAYVIEYKSKDFPLRPKEIKRGGVLVVK